METPHCDYSKWFYLCLSLVGVILAGLVMIFKYFLKLDRNGVKLGQADKTHASNHSQNAERIKQLEEKNGQELRKIEAMEDKMLKQRKEIEALKEVIKNKNKSHK